MITTLQGTRNNKPDIVCVFCYEKTADHGGYCMSCKGPLEVSRTVRDRETPARFASILGSSGAGKTVYLGMLLDMLTKGTLCLRGLPNGAFSVAIQQQTVHALECRHFPEKTPSEVDAWRWVHCEVTHSKRPKRPLDLVTPDFAGEAIALEVEHENTYPIIRSVVAQSEAILILFDSLRARDAGREEDLFAMKLMSYIATIQRVRTGRNWRKLNLPIVVVFTKADSCPEAMENPHRFAQATMPGMVQACRRYFSHYELFAAGIVGSSITATDRYGCRMHLPLHIEPRGIIEPLEWLINQL